MRDAGLSFRRTEGFRYCQFFFHRKPHFSLDSTNEFCCIVGPIAGGTRGKPPICDNLAVMCGRYRLSRRKQAEAPARLRRAARSLLFIQILAGNIILRHLMRANLLLVSVTSVFYARHCIGLERVSFLDQLGHTLRIRTFDVGQSL